MFWTIAYFSLACFLTLGGAFLTLFFMVPQNHRKGWRVFLEINRVRIFGFFSWFTGVCMILYGMWLEGWL